MSAPNVPLAPTHVGEQELAPNAPVKLTGARASRAVRGAFSHPLASLVVTVLTVLWTIPLLGFFINSFRPKSDVGDSGWWTWFAHPTSTTLGNYHSVLRGQGGLTLPLVN